MYTNMTQQQQTAIQALIRSTESYTAPAVTPYTSWDLSLNRPGLPSVSTGLFWLAAAINGIQKEWGTWLRLGI
jgi:hypothetical protein